MSCPGKRSCDVFDFSNAHARALFIEECVNATRTGFVDGCFCDRAVDGTPTDSGDDNVPSGKKADLTPAKAKAYFEGHIQVLTELQTALGEGPVIANHAYGPPHDAMVPGSVSFSMIESFGANNRSINQLLMNAKNKRGVQAHGEPTENCLAAFLIGAGHRAYFGFGGWSEDRAVFSDHWLPQFSQPLGEPQGDAIYDTDTQVWKRAFEHVNVTFDVQNNLGAIEGWDFYL